MKKECISNQDTLRLLKMIYGPSVVCTDGLYHLYDKRHNEIYINRHNSELDKRGLYRTLVVLDDIVVSRVVNNDKVNFVVLDKDSLRCIYKTSGDIFYANENLVYCKKNNDCTLISHTGNILMKLKDTISVDHIYRKLYIVKSAKAYNDKILFYNERKDTLSDLTEGLEYIIHILDKDSTKIDILTNFGAQYIYNFKEHTCFNTFTNKLEWETQLWRPV